MIGEMNWNEIKRKWSWTNFELYPGIGLEYLGKLEKASLEEVSGSAGV
jgi:hypothetical protein